MMPTERAQPNREEPHVAVGRYILWRLAQMIPVVLVIIVINFTLIHLAPGDPAVVLAGEYASADYIQSIRDAYGLEQPLVQQLGQYIVHVIQLDLGRSYSYNRPVIEIIMSRVPATLLLVITAQVLGVVVGTTLGTFAAMRYPSRTDSVLSMVSLGSYSMPVFWLGLMMILFFAVWTRWLPTSGMFDVASEATGLAAFGDLLRHMVLPVSSLMIGWTVPTFMRLGRASVIEIAREDFIMTARAKGLDEQAVYFKHALRNALLPTVTMAGLYLGLTLTGAVLTETVFSWPGIGRLMYEAVMSRDYPLLMGIFIFSAFLVVIASLLTDIVYAMLDPRVNY
jgi:peptide/nickel transport system permease protein